MLSIILNEGPDDPSYSLRKPEPEPEPEPDPEPEPEPLPLPEMSTKDCLDLDQSGV